MSWLFCLVDGKDGSNRINVRPLSFGTLSTFLYIRHLDKLPQRSPPLSRHQPLSILINHHHSQRLPPKRHKKLIPPLWVSPRGHTLPSLHLFRLCMNEAFAVVSQVSARGRVEKAKVAIVLDAVPVFKRGVGYWLDGYGRGGGEGYRVAGLFVED